LLFGAQLPEAQASIRVDTSLGGSTSLWAILGLAAGPSITKLFERFGS